MINKSLSQMNGERADRRAGHNLKLKSSSPHPQATSHKRQASSALKRTQLNNRVKKEREKKI
jgi:hypothetical protein